MTKADILKALYGFDDEEEVDLNELSRLIEEDRQACIEEIEERQHNTGFYTFQDALAMYHYER